MTDSTANLKYPELFFGFVAPIGADLRPALSAFSGYFQSHGYKIVEIKVTDLFNVLQRYIVPDLPLAKTPEQDRYETYIAYGNQIRAKFQDNILAASAIRRVMAKRLKHSGAGEFSKIAYLIHQFKRKEEVDLLRAVYGQLFFQVSIYSRRGARVEHLSRRFASSASRSDVAHFRSAAEALIERDENQVEERHGQRVATIFHDADFIVSLDATKTVQEQVHRFCELIFGSNSISPTRMEYGLFFAKAAALRSLDLSRQVGAAIFANTGEIISLGSNEVPKAGGGTYWADGNFDDRDYMRRRDSNEQKKREIFSEIVRLITPDIDPGGMLTSATIRETRLMDALEYSRVVHAEMSALSDAARCGRTVRDTVLYCTTFPCHMCAKHIVAAGIAKVVFLEPYPKSLAPDLHSDSIQVEAGDRGHYHEFPAVQFEHFYGVSPRRYREIFEQGRRKNDTGEFVEYRDGTPCPLVTIQYPFYAELERFFTNRAMRAVYSMVDEAEIARADDDEGGPPTPTQSLAPPTASRSRNARRSPTRKRS